MEKPDLQGGGGNGTRQPVSLNRLASGGVGMEMSEEEYSSSERLNFFIYVGQLVACGKRYLYKFHLIILVQGVEDNLIMHNILYLWGISDHKTQFTYSNKTDLDHLAGE